MHERLGRGGGSWTWVVIAGVAAGWIWGRPMGASADEAAGAHRPAVGGELELTTRVRVETAPGSRQYQAKEAKVRWKTSETAIVICDMWDDHWCKSAAQRVGVMAPRMNGVVTAARSHGVLVIHAPSDTMEFYVATPQRKRMQLAPPAKPPVPIARWQKLNLEKEPPLPIDDTDGGCDDAIPSASQKAWTRQHPAIDVLSFDGVTDSGEEVFNYCAQLGIRNLVIMGVHTNMCVLGRSFGIRQMSQVGMNVVLARDLTDAMYDPRDKPQVSHARGTHLVVEHIEKYWCPSIESKDLLQVVE